MKLSTTMGLFGMLTSWLVQRDLQPFYSKITFFHQLMFLVVHFSDRFWRWYNAPVVFGLLYLEFRRLIHQKYNLIAVGDKDQASSLPGHGFFGRNVLPQPEKNEPLGDPHPSVVAAKLLSRRELQDYGSQFNMLAASWINFMVHDWIDHLENLKEEREITAPASVAAQCPLKSFKFHPTREVPTKDGKIGHINTRTPLWDASVIYGSTPEAQKRVRTFQDGKLRIRPDGWLDSDQEGFAISGDIRNLWVGVATLQSLFIAEHNAICNTIKKAHPEYKDEDIFEKAKVVNAGVLAKIHTIDWTTQLLKNNVMLAAMRVNWYGLLGEWFKKTFGTTPISLLSGLVGMKEPQDHGVPYSLTEEFTSVYRLHPLLPESIDIKNINVSDRSLHRPPTTQQIEVPELLGNKGHNKGLQLGLKTLLTSFGHQSAGALTAFNYPTWMRNVTVQNEDGTDRPDTVDMASLEVYRDRERQSCRYNEFRRRMFMPTLRKWEDLTTDKETLSILRDLYGADVERLDLLPGLLIEKKIPGFAISETSFFIFLIMASRRLEADPLFTSDFNEEKYTKEGLKWVNTTEGLKDVLRRHHPELVGDWMTASSAFSRWDTAPEKKHCWPLYLRWGTGSPAAQ